ncbi:dGTPase [Roseivirga pacifica]|uniref:dGTPase n=1 Tax=Roseivirga pacifica TaxID=1267423 RepID=A0A1I0N0E4_9BACT|nr:dNTP triphosphohydrolase [Roseivirga pacifica]RKQ50825.1 dGTPase [Roseivirga pacifica]SEV94281.1 dGTPase [Roseivirga pacifica]
MNWQQLFASDIKEGNSPLRSPFDRDFDRIIFSHPFRRLQDKTQVHPLPEHDFVHNRLTHSLEVSSVGRSLGRAAGQVIIERNPSLAKTLSASDIGVVVASASLAHDIGNPPFGHSGETSISDFFINKESSLKTLFNEEEWADLINFEGNAQGFRLIARSGNDGLKLTNSTIGAFTKYPRPALVQDAMKGRRSQKKFGYYQSEAEVFHKLAGALQLNSFSEVQWGRHPLALLVEAADDICYHIIDLEDGCNLGLVSHQTTIDLLAPIIGKRFDAQKLHSIASKKEQIGLLRALTIGELIQQCVQLFLDEEQNILSSDFDKSLTDLIPAAEQLSNIIGVSIDNIYRSEKVVETEAAGYRVINGLLEVLVPAALSVVQQNSKAKDKIYLRLLPTDTQNELKTATTAYETMRVLLDFVSGLTDSYAVNLYRKINGTSLPGIG